jgi:hypothetical protein
LEKVVSNYSAGVAYGGGDKSTGDDALDILSAGGAVPQGTQFGIMYSGDSFRGYPWYKFIKIKSLVNFQEGPPFDNFSTLVFKQGHIKPKSFNDYFNDNNGSRGIL